ncbi:hypothetical protein IPA_08285 [Ignicoccus pacificus DSM 13166]|uniref:Uncharacterized protein n=1 Tax=Ignicoccus pacificus DSM 13166 TaxID=940294 RepID=A0A977KBU8_9CREN|nr:hypothetical protein IPA_08285 [Ignicoccus pacificus DSM 13166]
MEEEELLRFIREQFLSKALFQFLYQEASRLFGDTAARQLLFKIMKESTKMAVKEAQGYVKELIDPNKPCESFKLVYKVFGISDVECEVSGNKAHLIIKNCPLPKKYDPEGKGNACVAMIAIVAGMVEEIMGKKVYVETPKVRFGSARPDIVVEMKKNILMGDPYCEFEAEMKTS